MTLTRRFDVPTADAMRSLGAAVAADCVGGDVLVLTGDLGAGKTTFTQGLARGLGVVEAVTSPTFVIARVHRGGAGRPDLVHVDAYRLGSVVELDDLDLDADLERGVVVVEWGRGVAEGLSSSRLDLDITRTADDADESRAVGMTAHGDRWVAILGDDRWPP